MSTEQILVSSPSSKSAVDQAHNSLHLKYSSGSVYIILANGCHRFLHYKVYETGVTSSWGSALDNSLETEISVQQEILYRS